MPSKAFGPALYRMTGIRDSNTWTDDLPRCKLSGVGVSANQIYREDGTPCSEHEYEDRSIHFCIDSNDSNSTFIYGVFDGHDGTRAANFATQRMPAELSFEQLEGKSSEEEVKEIFHQAFISVENSFLESIDPKIAERTQLLEKIPENMKQFEAAQKFPDLFQRLQNLEEEIRGGTTALVALIHRNILYIGNIGNSRALLCQKDKSGILKVKQLTSEHTTSNDDELDRLAALSLDVNKMKGAKLGSHEITRCIGNYFLKGGYTEFELLSSATGEPVIAEPSIMSLPIDESCSFLLLMSDGLYKSYEEATGSRHVNKDIAGMVAEQFLEQTTLPSVAQTVVDKVVRLHHDIFLTRKSGVICRDDITLVVRNFNFQFPNAFLSQAAFLAHNHDLSRAANREATTDSLSSNDDLTLCSSNPPMSPRGRISPSVDSLQEEMDRPPPVDQHLRNFFPNSDPADYTDDNNVSYNTTSTESSKLSNPSLTQLTLEDGHIRPYVSFEPYFDAVEEAISNGTIPKSQIHLYK